MSGPNCTSFKILTHILFQEMEKLREDNLAAGREKVEAVSKAREEARREIQSQLDQIREQMIQVWMVCVCVCL